VAFIPANETFLQLQMLMFVLLSTLILQVRFWPWCSEEFNMVLLKTQHRVFRPLFRASRSASCSSISHQVFRQVFHFFP